MQQEINYITPSSKFLEKIFYQEPDCITTIHSIRNYIEHIAHNTKPKLFRLIFASFIENRFSLVAFDKTT